MKGKDEPRTEDEKIRRMTWALVSTYVQKFPGRADREDLFQVAALAETAARRTFRERGPAKLSTYVYRAINVALFEATCYAGAPVHVGRHNARKLLAAGTTELPEDLPDDLEVLEELGGLEGVIDRTRAYRRLREVVEATGGREVLAILLGEATVRGMAAELRVPVEEVRSRKRVALEALVADDRLRELAG